MPINSVVVPFPRHGGTLPGNNPGRLSLEKLLLDLNIGHGPEHAGYEAAVFAVFAALRAAYKTDPAAASDDWDAPEPSCHRRDDDFDDDDTDDVNRRGGRQRRRPSNNRDARRGTRGHSCKRPRRHSSSSSANKYRQRAAGTSGPPSVMARQFTPHLADVSGCLLGIIDSDSLDRLLSSTSARSLAAAAAAKQLADTQKAAADARREASRVAAIKHS